MLVRLLKKRSKLLLRNSNTLLNCHLTVLGNFNFIPDFLLFYFFFLRWLTIYFKDLIQLDIFTNGFYHAEDMCDFPRTFLRIFLLFFDYISGFSGSNKLLEGSTADIIEC